MSDIDMIKHIKSMNTIELSKMATELIGNQMGDKSRWMKDIINTRRKLQGKESLNNREYNSSEHVVIKAGAAMMIVAMIENEKEKGVFV